MIKRYFICYNYLHETLFQRVTMIIYHPKLFPRFKDFGIQIPMSNNRAEQIFLDLKDEFQLQEIDFSDITPITRDDLLTIHSKEYIDRLYSEQLGEILEECFDIESYGGKILDPQAAFNHILLQSGGTYFSFKQSLKNGFSFYLGGGMHHARSDRGSGFCLVHDVLIALKKIQVRSAWIVDVDAHMGDGTAEITQRDDSIKTLSIHMKDGWPFHTDIEVIASDIDIPITEGEEDQYLSKLEEGLIQLSKKFPRPEIVVVVDGADPYENDGLPGSHLLKLTLPQLLERDFMIYNYFKSKSIPQAYVLAGGYGPESYKVTSQFLRGLLTKCS